MIKKDIFLLSFLIVYISSSQIRSDWILPEIFSLKTNQSDSSSANSDLVVHNVTQFVVKVRGGWQRARYLANKYNLKLIKQEIESKNKLRSIDYSNEELGQDWTSKSKRGLSSSNDAELEILKSDPNIEWVQEQTSRKRVKRDFVDFEPSIFTKFQHKRNFPGKQDETKEGIKFNDPMWSKLWYINSEETSANSMRIKEAWELGFTGKGVVVTILDDGLEWDHPDIIQNYDPRASLDINDSDNDPRPRYDRYNYNKHGTRCAGEIAAMADNRVCSIGVAYNSKIGGIRMLDGEVTDLVEATALSYNRDYIDIYSASWGPDDDGKTVDGPGFLALKAIEDGIRFGRRGLGSIYVWASGNGGKDDDNCNCDGYTNSIYTISISSATQNGNIPWYSEACSSTLASTFSSGSYEERQIITTDLRKSCTEAHTGTSASAPLAAGIIALTLEANAELSWRDIQHIIVETSKPDNLTSSDWQLNGANRKVSHSFGFGMMDALAMVQLAKKWINVPNQRKCVIESSQNGHHQKPILIPKGDRLVIELYSSGCKGTKNEINYLEHVQAVVSVQSNSRGTLVVYLKSPMGTNSTLLDRRVLDQSAESFNKWPFTSVHMWGEVPHGTWIIEIKNNAKNTTYLNLNLILYGTKDSPQKRSAENLSKSSSIKNQETYEEVFLENVNNQEHKNRKAHGTNEDSLFKNNQLENFLSSQKTTSMTSLDEPKDFRFSNKLFQNSVFDQDYNDLKSNKDYITDFFKENSLYDNYANDEEYLDDSYEYKATSSHIFRVNKLIPSSERSSILELKYSAKTINSMAVKLESKLYTHFFLVILILLF